MGLRKKLLILILTALVVLAVFFAYKIVRSREASAGGGAGKSNGSIQITLDFNEEVGDIKPLNGINNGPLSKASVSDNGKVSFEFDVSDYYEEMNVPYVRLHDTEYPFGSDKFVDIHCIFPDFSADADDPASYYFEASDAYIAGVLASGAEVMYRLGESIDHTGDNTYINPPADYDKWAKICEHIIRHYNEGWDNGFHYDIKYWEIWNEPDNSMMWTGSAEEYCRLYAVTAKHLKACFPNLLIGGPAFTGINEETVRAFLDGIEDYDDVPLDFLSWHDYNDSPAAFAVHASSARSILDEYGYTDTLSVLNEWNYVESWEDQTSSIEVRNSLKGAAYNAASLMAMQYNGVDMAMYYDGQYEFADYYCGLYGRDRHIKPGFYAFKYWGELRNLGTQTKAEFNSEDGVLAVAARSKSGLRGVLIVNYNEKSKRVKLKVSDAGLMESVNIHRVNDESGETLKSSLMLFGQKSIRLKPGEIMYIGM